MAAETIEIPLVIGGREVRTGKTLKQVAPHEHGRVLAVCHQAAFGDELLIREQHGVAGDLQRGGQPAACRQARTGREKAGQDGVAQAVVEHLLARQRLRPWRGEQPVEFHRGSMVG